MEIWVTLHQGKLSVFPDPAEVTVGTLVRWRFQAYNISVARIVWTIDFHNINDSPFPLKTVSFVTTSLLAGNQHTEITGAMTADKDGQYKYGVRALDLNANSMLADEDPYLNVRPGVP